MLDSKQILKLKKIRLLFGKTLKKSKECVKGNDFLFGFFFDDCLAFTVHFLLNT